MFVAICLANSIALRKIEIVKIPKTHENFEDSVKEYFESNGYKITKKPIASLQPSATDFSMFPQPLRSHLAKAFNEYVLNEFNKQQKRET